MMESEKKSLDSLLSNLKLVKMEEDTKQAQDYIKENKGVFKGSGPHIGGGIHVKDTGRNQIIIADGEIERKPHLNHENIQQKLSKLADQVEKSAELFSQLDFLIRRRPVEESKRHDLKLIVDFIRFWSQNSKIVPGGTTTVHNLYKDDLLAAIGIIVDNLVVGVVEINSHVDVAVVSKLFTDLCQDVGLPVYVKFHDDKTTTKVSACCDGVITENSDHESAIDSFIGSTPVMKCPWKLRRLFIQESCYEECKNIFLGKNKEADISEEKCSARCELGGKQFVFDYVGAPGGLRGHEVQVEPYRTTKELLALLNQHQPRYLSLWSSYIAEANEIAYSSPGDFVWINDYCNFNGHSGFVTTFYQNLRLEHNVRVFDHIRSKSENWRKTDLQKRKTILASALNSAMKDFPNNRDCFKDIVSEIEKYECKQMVEVTKNKLVIGLHNAAEYFCVSRKYELLDIMLMLLNGTTPIFVDEGFVNVVQFICNYDNQIPMQIARLTKNGEGKTKEMAVAYTCWNPAQLKWIVTSFGTQFAN